MPSRRHNAKENVLLIHGDVFHPPLGQGTFDLVCSLEFPITLHYDHGTHQMGREEKLGNFWIEPTAKLGWKPYGEVQQ